MSLSIKSLQARSRAAHSALSVNAQELLACPAVIAKRQAFCFFGLPFAFVLRLTLLPLARRVTMPHITLAPSVASDLFALFAGSHTPNATPMSQVRGAYESIACRPSVGRYLVAKA